jgi:hypothetical protein
VSPPQGKPKSRFSDGLLEREDELNQKAKEARDKANKARIEARKKKKQRKVTFPNLPVLYGFCARTTNPDPPSMVRL